jgi:hypothetical protein
MQSGIKLISKPSQPHLCALVCATYMNRLGSLARESHYVIEDENGHELALYARNDADCHRKIVKRWLDTITSPTNPAFSQHNMVR